MGGWQIKKKHKKINLNLNIYLYSQKFKDIIKEVCFTRRITKYCTLNAQQIENLWKKKKKLTILKEKLINTFNCFMYTISKKLFKDMSNHFFFFKGV